MKNPPRIKSTFAVLDVKAGRKILRALVEEHKLGFLVVIRGTIRGADNDDGVSCTFEVDVHDVTLGVGVPREVPQWELDRDRNRVKLMQSHSPAVLAGLAPSK